MFEFKNKYTAIACINNNNAIGKNNDLICKIQADLANFKSLTQDNVVIIGRKTFESLGCKPLKNRVNIILTRNDDFTVSNEIEADFENTYICNTLEEVDNLCYAYFPDKELFIIGGGEIYRQAFDSDIIDKAILTVVDNKEEGDTYFHDMVNDDRYHIIFKTDKIKVGYRESSYHYVVYKRNKK